MILPIIAYGDPVLRETTQDIDADYPDLQLLIANMFETMYNAQGVGLAAPQVGSPIRLFIIDTAQLDEEEDGKRGFKKVFINATIIEETGKKRAYEEGCLSIPTIREDVVRLNQITIEYQDENLDWHEETFAGINARVIQHEYDHIEGVLFTDHLKPLKRRLLQKRLNLISKGDVTVAYKMKFPVQQKKRQGT